MFSKHIYVITIACAHPMGGLWCLCFSVICFAILFRWAFCGLLWSFFSRCSLSLLPLSVAGFDSLSLFFTILNPELELEHGT